MLSDVHCQVALLHHQEQVATGQRQQLVWSIYPSPTTLHTLLSAIRQQLARLLGPGDSPFTIQAIPPIVSHGNSSFPMPLR